MSVRTRSAALLAAATVAVAIGGTPSTAAVPTVSNWTQYQTDLAGSGFNAAETTITARNATTLTVNWIGHGGQAATGQPIVVGDTVYWGSWDGVLHANRISTGATLWTRPLGVTTCGTCNPKVAGMASTPAFGHIGATPVLWVLDGGNDMVGGMHVAAFAVNAATGAIIWRTNIIPVGSGAFAWSSVLLDHGSVYVSTASLADKPVIPGHIYQLNAVTGAIKHTVSTGGGVWGTPTIDTATGHLFVSVGGPTGGGANDFAFSLVELNSANLRVIAHWTVPPAQLLSDGDFGSVPTLFDATINGVARHMVGVGNKNGIFYAWDRANIAAGPVWERQLAQSGNGPQAGNGILSPAVWDGTTLYVAGGITTINGTPCAGGVRALDPATGSAIWQFCATTGHVIGAIAGTRSVLAVPAGASVILLDKATGTQLFAYHNPSGALYWGAPSVADGHVFAPAMDGTLTALSPTGGKK